MRSYSPLFLFIFGLSTFVSDALLPPGRIRITKHYLNAMKLTDLDKKLGFTEAKAKIKLNNGWAIGDGKDLASRENSLGLTYIFSTDFDRALDIFKALARKSPQFFPARYNLGKLYLVAQKHEKAILEFRKSILLIPQYWKNYYFLGRAYQLMGKYNAAIHNYRLAYQKNPYDLSSLVALGDLLIERKRLHEALNVFKFCLRQDDGYNDALLGIGKVAYSYGNYYDATIWFKTLELNRPYKKELHYYFGEAAFMSGQYNIASKEYASMLSFPQDAIYGHISLTRMRARLKQAKRLNLQSEN